VADFDAIIHGTVFLQDITAAIRRAVIDDDEFEIAKSLVEDAFHGLGKV